MKIKKLYVMIFTALAFVITFSGANSASASKWHKGIPTYLSGRYGRMQAGTQKGAYLYSMNWYQKDSNGSYNKKYSLGFSSWTKNGADNWGQMLDPNTLTNEFKSGNLTSYLSQFSGKHCKWIKTRYGYYVESKNEQNGTLKIKVKKHGLNHMKIVEYIKMDDKYVKVLDNSSFKRAEKINHLI